MATATRHQRPSLPRRFWDGWKCVGRRVGDFQARLLLTVFYFVIIAPFALAVRVATDPLALKRRTPRGWRPLPVAPGTPLERARRQS